MVIPTSGIRMLDAGTRDAKLKKKVSDMDKSYESLINSTDSEYEPSETEEPSTFWEDFKQSLRPLFRRKNIYLLLPLCSTGNLLYEDSRNRPTQVNNQSELVIIGHVTGYQPIRDQSFLIRLVPDQFHQVVNISKELSEITLTLLVGDIVLIAKGTFILGFNGPKFPNNRWIRSYFLSFLKCQATLIIAISGIYSQLYTPLIPSYIGMLFEQRSYIAEFGIFVGIGEIVGGQIAGRVVSRLGFKRSSVLVTLLGVTAYTVIAFMFPLFYNSAPVIEPNRWANNALGICIGIALTDLSRCGFMNVIDSRTTPSLLLKNYLKPIPSYSGVIDVSNNVIITTAIGTVYKDNSAQIFTLVVLMMNSSGIIRYLMMSYLPLVAIVTVNIVALVGSIGEDICEKRGVWNRPNQEILVPDWLITSHVTLITSSDWLFTSVERFLVCGFMNVIDSRTTPSLLLKNYLKPIPSYSGVIDVSNNVIITTAIGTVYKDNSAQIFTLVVLMMNSSGIIRYLMMSYLPLVAIVTVNIVALVGSIGEDICEKRGVWNRPNQEILVPDWLITSHVTLITSSDWLFTSVERFLMLDPQDSEGELHQDDDGLMMRSEESSSPNLEDAVIVPEIIDRDIDENGMEISNDQESVVTMAMQQQDAATEEVTSHVASVLEHTEQIEQAKKAVADLSVICRALRVVLVIQCRALSHYLRSQAVKHTDNEQLRPTGDKAAWEDAVGNWDGNISVAHLRITLPCPL
eukprot:sb/3462415/